MVFTYGFSSANRLLGGLEDTNFLAVFDLEANAVSLVGLRVEDGDVGSVQWRFFLDDTALYARHRVRLGMTLDQVQTTNNQTVVGKNLQHLTALTLVFAGDHDDLVVTTNLLHVGSPYSTSGASETIFMNFSVRSSRVTGPKIRVPIGSCLLFNRTAALPSKRMMEPSARRTPWRVRTTTAVITWPFLTLPRGIASFTVTLMMSPMPA